MKKEEILNRFSDIIEFYIDGHKLGGGVITDTDEEAVKNVKASEIVEKFFEVRYEEKSKKKEFKVYRSGRKFGVAFGNSGKEAIEKAQDEWIYVECGEGGCLTEYEKAKEEEMLRGKFKAKATGYEEEI